MGAYVFRRPWKTWRREKPKSTFVLPPAPPPTVLPDTIAHGRFAAQSYARDKKSVFRRPWWAWGYPRTTGVYIKNTGNKTGATTLGERAGFGATAIVTRRSAGALSEQDTLTATAIRNEKATSTLAERDTITATAQRTGRATATLAELDGFSATASRARQAVVTLTEANAINSPGNKTSRATITLAEVDGVIATAKKTNFAVATPSLGERSGQTDNFGPVTMRPAASVGVNVKVPPATAIKTNKSASTLGKKSTVTPNSSPAGMSFLITYAGKPGRRAVGKTKGYVFRRPWWAWGGAQARSSTVYFFTPPTTLRAAILAQGTVEGETGTAKRTDRATTASLATADSFINPTASRVERPAASLGEKSGLTVGPVRRNEVPQATLGVRETAAELPKEGERATATIGVRPGLTGIGNRRTAATVARNFGALGRISSAGNGGTWRAAALVQSISASFVNPTAKIIGRAAKNFNDLRVGVTAKASQIFNGAGLLKSKAALLVSSAKITVVYCYTFINAAGEAVSGSTRAHRFGSSALREQSTVNGNGRRTTSATISTLATKEAINGVANKTVRSTAQFGSKLGISSITVSSRRLVAWLATELDQIAVTVARRVERAAAFVSGVAGIVGVGKRTTAATVATFATKEAEIGLGVKTARSAAALSTRENETVTNRLKATPRGSLGTNVRIPIATFRVALTASYNFVVRSTIRAPGKIATSARSVVGALLNWIGIVPSPVTDYDPGRSLQNERKRTRSITGLGAIRSLRLNHKRTRSLP